MVLWSRVLEIRVDKWCCGFGFFEPRFEILNTIFNCDLRWYGDVVSGVWATQRQMVLWFFFVALFFLSHA